MTITRLPRPIARSMPATASVTIRKSTFPVSQNTHSPASHVARRGLPVSSATIQLPAAGFRPEAVLMAGSLLPSGDDEAVLSLLAYSIVPRPRYPDRTATRAAATSLYVAARGRRGR